MLIVLWSTRNIKSLFPLKDKVPHRSCVVYEGQCSCKLSYIEETKRNSEVGWREHENPAGKTEPAKHLMETLLTSLLGKYCRLHLHIFVEGEFWKRYLLQ